MKYLVSKQIALYVLFLSGLSFWIITLFSLGELLEVFEVSEAREGVVIQEIVSNDKWLLPLRHGEIVPSKPPLYHILAAGLAKMTGEFTELELRLPSLIAAAISLFANFIFLLKLSNPLTALIGTGILGTSYGFLQLSVDGRVDMLFNAFFMISYYLFTYHFIKKPDELPSRVFTIAIASFLILSVYTKGPLGLVLFVLYSAPLIFLQGSFQGLRKWYFNYAVFLTILASGLWYIVSSLTGKDGIFSRHIIFENIERFFGSSGIPAKPFWYYITHAWSQTFPWGILIVLLLVYMKFKKFNIRETLQEEDRKLLKTIIIQSSAILLFLSLASGKRRAYLLMLLPHFSCIAGILLASLFESYKSHINEAFKEKCMLKMIFTSQSLVLFSFFVCILSYLLSLLNLSPSGSYPSFFIGFLATTPRAFLVIFLICTAIHLGIRFFSRRIHTSGTPLLDGMLHVPLLLALQIYLAFPASFYLTKGDSHSYMDFARTVQSWRKEHNNPEVRFIKKRLDEAFDTFFYYYGERIRLHPDQIPSEDGYFIARKSWLEDQGITNQEGYHPLLEGGKKKDKKENYIVLFQYDAP